MGERNYWLGFSVFSGIGPMKFKKLFSTFGSAKDAWEASKSDLRIILGEKLTIKFDDFRSKFSISGYVRILLREGVSFLTLEDEGYPELLKKIRNPPFLLYVKGDAIILYSSREGVLSGTPESRSDVIPDPVSSTGQALIGNPDRGLDSRFRGNDKFSSRPFDKLRARTITPTIAVVGTRRTTQYGREVTKILVEELVAAGFTIVSGLAIGVDAISHKTAIENNGKTIAVLGCGVDCCYPTVNQHIYNSIVNGSGCIVSEYPLGQLPTKGSFPARNRIIAGLSTGVLVTEGAEDSGSLITADYAIKFGRPVFAVPGPITSSLSKGPYKLIEKGAKLVTKAEDILRELKIQNSKVKIAIQNSKVKDATEEERKILEILRNEPLHFDEIVRKTGLQSATIGSMLSVMEMKGLIKSLEGGIFSI